MTKTCENCKWEPNCRYYKCLNDAGLLREIKFGCFYFEGKE